MDDRKMEVNEVSATASECEDEGSLEPLGPSSG